MFAILIVLCLLQWWLIFAGKNDFAELRLPLVKAAVAIFALIFLNTEILSFFNAVTALNMTALWTAENLGALGFLYFRNRHDPAGFGASLQASLVKKYKENLVPQKTYLAVLLAIYAAIFFVAILSSPNTADSQTYHLARVANWIQLQNVDFYPTATLRQLYSNPLAEYGILNILLLASDDRLANLLQFGCLAGSGLIVSLIAREFRADFGTQLLAWLLTTTIPMAVLQASSTQNDLVVAFLALAFFLFYLRASQTDTGKLEGLVLGGFAAGLAVLTKGTAYIYCAAIGAVVFGAALFSRRPGVGKLNFFALSLLILAIAVSLNSIQYARNYRLFGSPIATGEESYGNKNITPRTAAAGLVKNYVMHLGTFFDASPPWIERQTKNLFGSGFDRPETNFLEMRFAVEYSDHEDKAGNFIQLVLLTLGLLLVVKYRRALDRNVFLTALTVPAGFFLLAVLLKWNPWLSRLQIPFFMLGNAVFAAVLSRLNAPVRAALIAVCLLGAANALLMGQPRSILSAAGALVSGEPRAKEYFANQPGIAGSYMKVAAFVREQKPPEVGLALVSDYRRYNFGDWEYPLWVLLKNDFSSAPELRHVGIKNVSNRLTPARSLPEWLITSGPDNIVDGVSYDEVLNEKPLRVLRKRAE